MKAPALAVYISVTVGAAVNLSVQLNSVAAQVGEDFSRWPSLAAVAGLAESWVVCVLVMAFGVLLDERGREREREDPAEETRVVVKTPQSGDHKVSAKVVVTNYPRRANDDSSEFELTLD